MFYLEMIYAMLIALAIALVWTIGLRKRGPWATIPWFVLAVFLCAWAGGIWVSPFGPTGWGVSLLPFLLMGTLGALFLVSAAPHVGRIKVAARRKAPDDAHAEHSMSERNEGALNAFFWVVTAVMLVMILSRYTWYQRNV